MEADWEVEIGGGAPVIDVHWRGFIDLRAQPERICEIAEIKECPPLADLLLRLNSEPSQLQTSKCDVWQLEPNGMACYIDVIPRDGNMFADWKQAEAFCREQVVKLVPPVSQAINAHPLGRVTLAEECPAGLDADVTLVVRRAIAEQAEGFGIAAYFSVDQPNSKSSHEVLARVFEAFADALVGATFA